MTPERKQKLQDVFDANPKLDELYVCEDDQAFATNHSARNHATTIAGTARLNEGQEPVVVTRTELTVVAKTTPAPPKTGGEPEELTPAQLAQQQAKALVAKVEAAATVEEVDALIAGITWKSVLKAAEARKAELVG